LVKLYKDIFFDLDRTLWDFERNSEECLSELFIHYNLSIHLGTEFIYFLEIWKQANQSVWDDFRKGIHSKEEIRLIRFELTFKHFQYNNSGTVSDISADYVGNCPLKTHLISGAERVLDYLNQKYRLHLITNGFAESQRKKIKASGLDQYFRKINISEETSFRKPQRKMFELALQRALASNDSSIMIGDDISKDILGAKKVKMDQVHYNPDGKSQRKVVPTYTISRLEELMNIL